jgi:hypothetical protein
MLIENVTGFATGSTAGKGIELDHPFHLLYLEYGIKP